MQAPYAASVKGGLGVIGVPNQRKRVLLGFGEVRNRTSSGLRSLCMTDRSSCCAGLSLSSVAMGAELARARVAINGVFGSSAKPRSVKAQATGLFITVFNHAWLCTSVISVMCFLWILFFHLFPSIGIMVCLDSLGAHMVSFADTGTWLRAWNGVFQFN